MSEVREVWNHKRMSASGTLVGPGGGSAGFLCNTAGDVTISAGTASGGTSIVVLTSCVAGQWYPCPFLYPTGAYVTIANGAVVTFGVE